MAERDSKHWCIRDFGNRMICGRDRLPEELCFRDLLHACGYAAVGGSLTICPACFATTVATLEKALPQVEQPETSGERLKTREPLDHVKEVLKKTGHWSRPGVVVDRMVLQLLCNEVQQLRRRLVRSGKIEEAAKSLTALALDPPHWNSLDDENAWLSAMVAVAAALAPDESQDG